MGCHAMDNSRWLRYVTWRSVGAIFGPVPFFEWSYFYSIGVKSRNIIDISKHKIHKNF